MGQFFFFVLFIIALIAGIYAYLPHSGKSVNPVAFISDTSGYTAAEDRNSKKMEQANITTSQGLVQVHRQMDILVEKQKSFSNMLSEQEQVLQTTGKQASQILAMAQQAAQKEGKDVLRLKDVAIALQNQQRLLVEDGRSLIALNNQIINNRDWIHDQMDLIDANNVTTQATRLQGQYTALKDQSATFFDKVTEYHQQVQQYMQTTQDQLNDTVNQITYDSSLQQQAIRDKIRLLLEKQHENMLKLSESRQRSQILMRDQEEALALSQELLNNSIRHTKELIGQERRDAKEKQRELQQKIQDQMDRMKDKQ